MRLIKDSKNNLSWTVTFCVITVCFTIPVFIVVLVGAGWIDKEIIIALLGLVGTMWTITIGAFIAREVTEKIKGKFADKDK